MSLKARLRALSTKKKQRRSLAKNPKRASVNPTQSKQTGVQPDEVPRRYLGYWRKATGVLEKFDTRTGAVLAVIQ